MWAAASPWAISRPTFATRLHATSMGKSRASTSRPCREVSSYGPPVHASTMWASAHSSVGLVGPDYQFTSLAINNRHDIQGHKTVTKGVAIAVTPSGPIMLTNPWTHECFAFDSPSQYFVVDYTSANVAVAVFDAVDIASSKYGTIGMNVSVPHAMAVAPVPRPTTLAENPLTPAMEGKNVTLVLGTNGAVALRSPRFRVCYTFSHGDRMPLVWYDFSQPKGLAKRVLTWGASGVPWPRVSVPTNQEWPREPELHIPIAHYTGECS